MVKENKSKKEKNRLWFIGYSLFIISCSLVGAWAMFLQTYNSFKMWFESLLLVGCGAFIAIFIFYLSFLVSKVKNKNTELF